MAGGIADVVPACRACALKGLIVRVLADTLTG